MTRQEILSHFKGVKPSGENAYLCLCPVHDDHHPSCYILFYTKWAHVGCFVKCEKDDILSHAGLTRKDLYLGDPQDLISNRNKVPMPPIEYKYCDEDGKVLYIKFLQYASECSPDEKKRKKDFWYMQPNGKMNLKDVKRVPFQLPLLKDAKTIYIVEGEKCASIVTEKGYVATTLDCGAGSKWNEQYYKYFEGKEVVILPDHDEPGMKYARMLKQHLPWAVIKELPDLDEAEDVYDWLQKGHSMDEIQYLPEYVSKPTDRTSEDKMTQSELLLEFIKEENVELFLNDCCEPYVAYFHKGRREVFSVNSDEFKQWAQMLYYKKIHKTIRRDNLLQALEILSFEARDKEQTIKLYNRVANTEDIFWYDMTDKQHSAIKITSEGWSIVNLPPILFMRYGHQEPQVIPQQGGDINKIFEYVNVVKFKTLFLCWLVSCFVPDIPHAITIIHGEKGAAKSTTCELIKKLIDPSALDTLNLSNDERSLRVSLQKHYYLPYDNVSEISKNISNILCRAVTGGAFLDRKLHTNADDFIFKFKRCVTINGINNVANRSDLLDRSIILELERISDSKRREQRKVYRSFEEDRPYILGAIFDVLSKAMKIYPTIKLEKLPRMADFCRWGYAIGEAIGGYGDEFLKEYETNRSIQNKEAIESDIVSYLIYELMRGQQKCELRVSDWLTNILTIAPQYGIDQKHRDMPKCPNQLSKRIVEVKSNLNGMGITYEFDRKRKDGTYLIFYNDHSSTLPPYDEVIQ